VPNSDIGQQSEMPLEVLNMNLLMNCKLNISSIHKMSNFWKTWSDKTDRKMVSVLSRDGEMDDMDIAE
jgi:hypothetical protein